MRVWTMQPAELYAKLESNGLLLTDGRRCTRYFKSAYQWIIASNKS